MPKIRRIAGLEVLDSRGNPTVMAQIFVDGAAGAAAVGEALSPSGVSTGRHEAFELRDGDRGRFRGQGVREAVGHVNGEIQAALMGMDTANQAKIDRVLLELDGTPNKSRLGANAVLAVSLACARAEALSQNLPLYRYLQQLFPEREAVLPLPQMNLINGGLHASNNLSVQEYHLLPVGRPSFSEALRMGVEVYLALRELLAQEGFQVEIADEGGFAPKLSSSELAFTFLIRAIEQAGYVPGVDAFLGIDAAANEFFNSADQTYQLDGASVAAADLAYQYQLWRERYWLISLEDPFAEDAWESWQRFTKAQGARVQVVGDDLYATNSTRIREGVVREATNAVLIKPNQVGTLTETLQAILVAQEAGQNVVISHRSGETEDTFIADLCVAVGAGQIKTGAPSRSDRTSKYNRLLVIEAALQGKMGSSLQRFLEHIRSRAVSGAKAGS